MVSNRSITLSSLLLHRSPSLSLSPLKQQDWRLHYHIVLWHWHGTLRSTLGSLMLSLSLFKSTLKVFQWALLSPAQRSCSPLRQVCPSCCDQVWCHMDWPGIKTTKILPVTPGLDHGSDLLWLSDSFLNPWKYKDRGKTPCIWFSNQSFQGPEVSSDCPQISCYNFITFNNKNG